VAPGPVAKKTQEVSRQSALLIVREFSFSQSASEDRSHIARIRNEDTRFDKTDSELNACMVVRAHAVRNINEDLMVEEPGIGIRPHLTGHDIEATFQATISL
jgi:hypothetical protein